MNASTALFTAHSAPALVSPGGAGGISGGALRPGSIDQGAFIQQLQAQQAAQQAARQAAGVGGRPVTMAVQPFQGGIPTLSSAQFAALVGARAAAGVTDTGDLAGDLEDATGSTEPGSDLAGEMPDAAAAAVAASRAAPASPTAQMQAQAAPQAAPVKLSGAPRPQQTASSETAAPQDGDAPRFARADAAVGQGVQMASAETGDDAPTFARAAAPAPTSAEPSQQTAAVTEPSPPAASTKSKSGAEPADPKVVHFTEMPDKDTQKDLRVQGKRWVIDERPGSRQLFFGEDGKFGWDDFLDVINPLQHIPIVSQIYRAVTGDQINAAAELIGSIPFGPLGSVGFMAALADVAVKDTTGKDVGQNLQAMIFGDGQTTTTPAGAAAAERPDAGSPDTDAVTGADTGADTGATTQTAALETASLGAGYDAGAASQQHESCRG